jgi:carbon monoxide dehydrogenase subunit G
MEGEQSLPAAQQVVWNQLNDPAVLKLCIPGCESLEVIGENEFRATATNKVGPVKIRFTGTVRLSDIDPPHSYRISGEGEGGLAGFAKGSAHVSLVQGDEGTRLHYRVDAQIGGKLAQLGQRLINSAAKKMADDFFSRFSESVR